MSDTLKLEMDDGAEFQFSDDDALRDFALEESKLYSRPPHAKPPGWENLAKAFNNMAEAKSRAENPNVSSQDILATLKAAYDGGLLHPKTPQRQLAELVGEHFGYLTKVGFIHYALCKTLNIQHPYDKQENGALVAQLLMDDSLNEIDARGATRINTEARKSVTRLTEDLKRMIQGVKDFRTAAETELTTLKESYKEIQQFKEPASYWNSRCSTARWASIGLMVAAILSGSIGGYFLLAAAHASLDQISTESVTSYLQLFPHTFPVLVAAFGLFWLLRVLLKLALSQWHVMADAAERRTMVTTWQAMQVGGSEPSPEERVIILQQLFRHNPTGLVPEDTAPNVVLNKLTES